MDRTERLKRAAPTMAAVYERRFGIRLVDRVGALLKAYPNVTAPNWISWEGHTTTNAATSRHLAELLSALEG